MSLAVDDPHPPLLSMELKCMDRCSIKIIWSVYQFVGQDVPYLLISSLQSVDLGGNPFQRYQSVAVGPGLERGRLVVAMI